MKRSVNLANELKQQDVVIVVDQAIYALAQDVMSKHCEEFKHVVLRLGGFHFAMTMMAVIGKRFADSGLQSILVESGLAGEGAVQGVLNGKHYNRALRCHKIVMEAFFRLCWQAFEQCLDDHPGMKLATSAQNQLADALNTLRAQPTKQSLWELLSLPAYADLQRIFASFVDGLKSPLSQLWLSYVQMVHLLLQFLRASRTGNWYLHMLCVRRMLSWMVAYDRPNYTRYGSLYWCQMLQLEGSHPEVYEQFLEGEFCVQRCSTSAFSQVPVDQAIEQTVNRHTKTKGGIVGFSQKPGAVQQWIVNAHQRADVTRNVLAMAGMEDSVEDVHVHKEAKPTRRAKDEQAVLAVVNVVLGWKNPFLCAEDEPMSNISSGLVAPPNVSNDLLSAFTQGEEHLRQLIKDRLITGTVKFQDPLPAL